MDPIKTARERLTDRWQRLSDIRVYPNAGEAGYADLVWSGEAEVKREHVIRHGIQCGEFTFFRLRERVVNC